MTFATQNPRRRTIPRYVKRILTLALTALLVVTITAWVLGGRLCAPNPQEVGQLPPDLTGHSIEFASESGSQLHGWFIPGEAGRGTIVLMHGVRATRSSMIGRARFLSRAGYSVLLFDFQAHGESKGDQIGFGYLESKDAQAAVAFAHRERPDEKLGVIGVSMGGAAALLASPPLEVDAMVLESVYPTMDEAIANRLKVSLGDWAGVLTPLLSWQFRPRLGVSTDALRPIDQVGKVSVPKLFIAGADDQYTTLDESKRLFEAAAAPKELWVVEHAAHVDLHQVAGAEYEKKILDFFKGNLSRSEN